MMTSATSKPEADSRQYFALTYGTLPRMRLLYFSSALDQDYIDPFV